MRGRAGCRLRAALPCFAFGLLAAVPPSAARPGTPPQGTSGALQATPARQWIDAAANSQVRILNTEDRLPLRYRVHKVDDRGDVAREVMETQEGNVARLVARDGAALTAAEDSAERQRLGEILASPGTFLSHEQRDRSSRRYILELIRAMPGAMEWSYTPGQPQLPESHAPQVVIDFTPNPAFKPPTLVTEALTGIAGRVWIDAESRCVLRVEGHILRPANIGWAGMLARVAAGGTVAFEQADAGGGRWVYTRLSEHLAVREVMVHTVRQDAEVSVSAVQHLPSLPGYREAIQALLAMPVPVR